MRITILLALAAWCVIGFVTVLHRGYSLGFAADSWRKRPVMEFIRKLPADAAVYSNVPSGVWYATGREIRTLPEATLGNAGVANLPGGSWLHWCLPYTASRRYVTRDSVTRWGLVAEAQGDKMDVTVRLR